ncbi:helix-turn-helix transcriptional regulator [Gramella jeungdoensis]|uniref:Helix-turn-helix transcriptional regulator n=1 Tax=Gramella jeungdoensis TaxID=708091 RepID=A0ABT0Z2N5_9FLAO|nr:helix-turn-helix transcriptional regulator [Gramella jeungdoensis]MCM8570001.1 helix-turn-helix transcriptional regulator [Gramella jeungdoensis]
MDTIIKIINFILLAGVIQGFVFNIFTIHITKKKVGWAVIYLNLTVLVLSLNNLQAWLIEVGFSTNNFFFKQLLVPWYMFISPTFHAFLIHYLRIQKTIKSYIKPAIIIFIIELILRIGLIAYAYYFLADLDDSIIKDYNIFEEIFNAIFNLFIFYKCLRIVFAKQHLYPFILKYDDIGWLRIFLKLGGFVLFLWLVGIIGFNISGERIVYFPLKLGTSLLIYWIGYQGFYRYHNVNDRISIRRSISSNKALKINEGKLDMSLSGQNELNSKHQKDFEKIDSYIIEKQSYLDPNLGLEELANQLDMSPTHLSKIINTYSNYNFSDYINSLRIQQAKKLLNDDSFCRYTIVSIGLECGFNSKSTFYSAFKKFTSQTPSEYRETTC